MTSRATVSMIPTPSNPEALNLMYGLAPVGTIVTNFSGTKKYKIVDAKRVNYSVMDEAGNRFVGKFSQFRLAPEGTSWAGAEPSPVDIEVGDVVEFFRDKERSKFAGKMVVTKQTSERRFNLQAIGSHHGFRADVDILRKVKVTF